MANESHKVFIDSSTFIAFTDRADVNHAKALRAMENMARLNYFVYTSGNNIQETYNALSRELGVSIGLEFLKASLESDMEILYLQKGDLASAYKLVASNTERQVGLREALNATLMQRHGIPRVVTFLYWHNFFGTSTLNFG